MANFIVQQHSPNSIPPTLENRYFYASEDTTIEPYSHKMVPTGISTKFDSSHVLLVRKYNLHSLAGVIDSDYRGEIFCILYNHTNTPIEISTGEKVAQFDFLKLYDGLINDQIQLTVNKQREGGFGSTGKL